MIIIQVMIINIIYLLVCSYKNPLQNFRLDKYFGLFEGYAETLRGNCSDFRQIDQY
jgi:hypothetical protein